MNKIEIVITAGKGGNGMVNFWREKFRPFGGPDGGDGGKGGSIYIKADRNTSDLSVFRHKSLFKAEIGENGGKQKKHGRDGKDLFINVPVGTAVYIKENNTGVFLADLKEDGQSVLVTRGGKGGKGNVHFATSTNQAPRKATAGKAGEEVRLILEYKIVADVCIIGLPNSGKSALLAKITDAEPKIADYPYTTIEPIIGQVKIGYKSFTIAEIPAISAGAYIGKGLGNKFLSHTERAKVLLFILDGTSQDIIDDINVLIKELELYNPDLLQKQKIVAVNKEDLPEVEKSEHEIRNMLSSMGPKVYFISAKSGSGITELITAIADTLEKTSTPEPLQESPEYVFRPKPVFRRKK